MADNRIHVKAAKADGRVAFWERNQDQPDGEVYVSGERVVEITKTPAANAAIMNGRIVVVPAPAPTAAEKKAAAAAEKKAAAAAEKKAAEAAQKEAEAAQKEAEAADKEKAAK